MIETYNSRTCEKAVALLKEGQVIGLPTETVYGLAADSTNDFAVARIYETKERPNFNPLIIHVDSVEKARKWGKFNLLAEKLACMFWTSINPRPLTLVMKTNNTHLSPLVTAGLDTVAIRIPFHPIALDVLKNFDKPLAAPSANRSNHISPTTAQAVMDDLGLKIPLVINGGDCQVGIESTIIDVSSGIPVLLRPGGTTIEEIERVLERSVVLYQDIKNEIAEKNTSDHANQLLSIKAPGMLKRHYAPSIPLRLDVLKPYPNEAYLAFGKKNPNHTNTVNLSESEDLTEAAANLFRMMRLLDNSRYQGICVAPIPNFGLGVAINDRLKRASSN